MEYKVFNTDILKFETDKKYHACFCDPPYVLTSANHTMQKAKAGFMSRKWDASLIAFYPETWAHIASLLYPGAFIFAFGGTRTYHRMVCAMEDAGLIIHACSYWVRGAGFRKATNVSKQIDKANGTTEQARIFEGHFYGRQALKPLVEPIAIAQVPYEGKPVECIMETGAGTYNIDAARVGNDEHVINRWDDGMKPFGNGAGHQYTDVRVSGRWPPNMVLVHDERCVRVGTRNVDVHKIPPYKMYEMKNNVYNGGFGKKIVTSYVDEDGTETIDDWQCVEGCPVKLLNEQSGVLKSGGSNGSHCSGIFSHSNRVDTRGIQPDEGYASRFYPQLDYVLDKLEPFYYSAQASRSERDAGLDEFDEVVIEGADMLNGSTEFRNDSRHKDGGYSVTKLPQRNIHPTCKPLKLCKWLSELISPPEEYEPRKILVPFSGAGSEMIGAMLSGGFDVIHGVEIEPEYVDIANARLNWWNEMIQKCGGDIQAIMKLANEIKGSHRNIEHQIEDGQMELF